MGAEVSAEIGHKMEYLTRNREEVVANPSVETVTKWYTYPQEDVTKYQFQRVVFWEIINRLPDCVKRSNEDMIERFSPSLDGPWRWDWDLDFPAVISDDDDGLYPPYHVASVDRRLMQHMARRRDQRAGLLPARPKVAQVAEPSSLVFPAELVSGDGTCVVCLDGSIETLLDTCGHVAMCLYCAGKLAKADASCPICRAPFSFQDVRRAYPVQSTTTTGLTVEQAFSIFQQKGTCVPQPVPKKFVPSCSRSAE
jgi:hypothetical protein